MKTRTIGDREVDRIGLGCMGMSFAYGPADENESLGPLARVREVGVDHWDNADF
ncbi:hypothetical protein BH11ARM2_BH11ARM2_09610 [soil metagenome]